MLQSAVSEMDLDFELGAHHMSGGWPTRVLRLTTRWPSASQAVGERATNEMTLAARYTRSSAAHEASRAWPSRLEHLNSAVLTSSTSRHTWEARRRIGWPIS